MGQKRNETQPRQRATAASAEISTAAIWEMCCVTFLLSGFTFACLNSKAHAEGIFSSTSSPNELKSNIISHYFFPGDACDQTTEPIQVHMSL